MGERAHPQDPGFAKHWNVGLRKGFVPWLTIRRTLYGEAAVWRFKWVARECRGKDVLDVPCGMGWGTSYIKLARTVTGLDLSESAIEEANERYGRAVRFQVGSMGALPFPAESFDVVSCLEGIEHVPVEIGARFLREAFRVLRSGGVLLLSSPYCRSSLHSGNPYHVHEYQPGEIKEAVQRWFRTESTIERNVDVMRVMYIKARKGEHEWSRKAEVYLLASRNAGMFPSTCGGATTLYGSVYGNQALQFLDRGLPVTVELENFVREHQRQDSGLFLGPEFQEFKAEPGKLHDLEHLSLHSTAAVLPFCQEFAIEIGALSSVQRFCDVASLNEWCQARDWRHAWFEGNNILFIGQLLVYLRDVVGVEGARDALDRWFDWLDEEVDPVTSLWGTNGSCSSTEAVYGGYHQLLVYWHENRPIANPRGLVDTVLSLQHPDGGFNPSGNGGACEDVDSVDILVNCYKRFDYRRAGIRRALWHCADHILSTQNPDGGFPYNRDQPQSHMGLPGTQAEPNVSCTFPTWFRIHTLALCHEIIPEHPALAGVSFRFNQFLSMGWHKSPPGWKLEVSDEQRREEAKVERAFQRRRRVHQMKQAIRPACRFASRVKNRIMRRGSR